MMSHVMGLYRERALEEACKLGIAMQLTNISRDVKEDFERGRFYLPQSWPKEYGLSETDLFNDKQKLFLLVKRLITISEEFYIEGRKGISELPLKGALAVTIASLLYREIGREILRRGESALETRTTVNFYRKFLLVGLGVYEILKSLPERIKNRKKVIPIKTVWRPYEVRE